MQIVTDSGTDVYLNAQEREALNIHTVPLVVTLDGKSYREGVNITPQEFYPLLEASGKLPTTSQPSAGDFAEVYRKLAANDPDILSIHITAGLSGTFNSAKAGAQMVPEARVTHVNTKTLSAAAGWQVVAAARAALAGWTLDNILPMLQRISDASESIYTLDELKYLIHGGRISHLRGLLATTLNIKPVIAVDKEEGKYAQRARVRTFSKAVEHIPELIAAQHAPGTAMQVQIMHARNIESAEVLHDRMDKKFKCTWLPTSSIAPVLGAHTGAGLVGLAYAPLDQYPEIP